ncbi:proton channel OtopLc-like isoform X1 [Ostrinia furnacalis]|uniref:proton channel OtopLc-like isoform X1 n=1 Tax=Ostrinia furnacalis TaxID=93504 RepID=UPI00103C154F|nr:proton channel OtopLc-like isoform X1 [Ostrinia furnacalis]
MTDPNFDRKEMLDEIITRKKLGDKKFHSETSLQRYNEDEDDVFPNKEKDPGVLNTSVNTPPSPDESSERRRTMSQPGPVSGGLVTASAARAARKRPPRTVAYAGDNSTEQIPKALNGRGDESGTNTPIVFFVGDRSTNSPLPYNGTLRNGDAKSLNSYRIFASTNDLRGVGTPRKRSVATMDAQSLRSVETHAPPPTSPEDNKKLTKKYLTLVIGCIYATILVTCGLIIHIGSPIVGPSISVIFSLVLCSTGLLYHVYLLLDINRYKKIALKNQRIKSQHEENLADYFRKQEEYAMNSAGDRNLDMRPPAMPPAVLGPLNHDYCFSQGRHSGSFYLKLGAAGFALGHLIHSVLLLAVQIGQLVDDDVDNDECVSILQVALDILAPLYSFVQLYFIFKYSNVIILKAQSLAHLALMHIIGSSLCFWVSAIVREIVLALTLYANTKYGNSTTNGNDTNYDEDYGEDSRFIDISGLYNQHCDGTTALTNIKSNFSPYLYPFSVEFNILIVAIYYIIWSNVGHCENEDATIGSEDSNSIDDTGTICKIPTAHEDNDFTSNIVIHADCHASNRGLFLGLIFMVGVAGMLIIGYIFSSFSEAEGDYLGLGYMLNDCTTLAMHIILLFAVVIAFNQMRKLDINEHPVSLLDDVLLFICLPAFTLETVLSLVATISILNAVKIATFIAMAIQVLIQTPLIMDGLRRCSNSKKLRRQKPGREVLMFLIIGNVGMWLFYTFSYKSPESLDERYEFYGKVVWSILGHVSLPLIMFYRFHSSVCFADIWNSAYKPGSEH